MLIKGRQWYINTESLLFVQFRPQDVKNIPFYQLGTMYIGIFPDDRTLFRGTVVKRTKTGLLMDNWMIYGAAGSVSRH